MLVQTTMLNVGIEALDEMCFGAKSKEVQIFGDSMMTIDWMNNKTKLHNIILRPL